MSSKRIIQISMIIMLLVILPNSITSELKGVGDSLPIIIWDENIA